jgi:hypothetical protein
MPMNATTDAKATAQTALGWRHMGRGSPLQVTLTFSGEISGPLGVIEQTAHDPYRLGERLTVSVVEPREALIDRGAALGMVLSQHGVALGCDADQHGPGVGGVGRP